MEERSLERMMENSPPWGGENEILVASTGRG